VLDAKEAARVRKATAQRERDLTYAEQRQERMFDRFEHPAVVENEKLVSLRGKLAEAREELILAEVEVEVAVTTVEVYKMLSQSQ